MMECLDHGEGKEGIFSNHEKEGRAKPLVSIVI